MTQGVYNFPDVVSGDTSDEINFQIKKNNIPDDLTGAEIRMAFSDFKGNIIKSFITPSEISIFSPLEGKFKIKSYSANIPARKYNYDIQIKYANNEIKTYIRGQINILPQVSI